MTANANCVRPAARSACPQPETTERLVMDEQVAFVRKVDRHRDGAAELDVSLHPPVPPPLRAFNEMAETETT